MKLTPKETMLLKDFRNSATLNQAQIVEYLDLLVKEAKPELKVAKPKVEKAVEVVKPKKKKKKGK